MSAPRDPMVDLGTAEQDERIVQLKREGRTFQEIAATMGISKTTAIRGFHRVKQRVERRAEEDYATYRDEQLARIEVQREVVMDVMTGKHLAVSNGIVVRVDGEPLEDSMPALAAVDRLVKLDDQEAKLVGIYAEKKVAVTGGLRYEIVGVDPEALT